MSIGGIQGHSQQLQGLGKAAQAQDPKVKELEQELKQIEEGMKLAAAAGNPQLLAMLAQQLQQLQQSSESSSGQDQGDQKGGGGRAQGFEARKQLEGFQQKAELLAQEIALQLQSVQAASSGQGAQGSSFQQDQNQAQGRDMRSMYPV